MGNRKEVLIIIPAYNEEKTIVPVLEKLEQPEIAQIADVLVMNDASSDATKHVTKKRKHDVVTHVFNLGYGSGLQLGYKYAVRKDYRYVIQMDADGQHDVCNIPKIYEALQTRDENGELPDIVLGSRFMEGSTDFPVSPAKKIAFAWFRTMLRLGTGRSISDPTTGLQGLSWRTFLFYSKYDNFDDKYPDANAASGIPGQGNSGSDAHENRRSQHAFRAEANTLYVPHDFFRSGSMDQGKNPQDG